jgi:uncharacterized membrane protein
VDWVVSCGVGAMRTRRPRDITPLLSYGYRVNIGEYLGRGWDLLQPKLGIFAGYVLVLFGIGLALSFVPSVVRLIVNTIISPPLYAGLFIVAHKLILEEPVEFGDFFKGFEKFGVFLAAVLVPSLLIFLGTLLCIIPGIYLGTAYSFNLLFICIIPGIYLGTAYSFTLLFIIDQGLGFWPAMENSRKLVTRNFFPMFGFLLLLGLINLGGVILCGLGLLLTVPLTCCAMTVAYMDIVDQVARD